MAEARAERGSVERVIAEIGQAIRAERQARGWSLRALAERASVSASLLSAVENGKIVPTVASLFAVAAAFGVPPQQLFPPSWREEAPAAAPASPPAAPASAPASPDVARGAAPGELGPPPRRSTAPELNERAHQASERVVGASESAGPIGPGPTPGASPTPARDGRSQEYRLRRVTARRGRPPKSRADASARTGTDEYDGRGAPEWPSDGSQPSRTAGVPSRTAPGTEWREADAPLPAGDANRGAVSVQGATGRTSSPEWIVRAHERRWIEIVGGLRMAQVTPTTLPGIEIVELVLPPGASTGPEMLRHSGTDVGMVIVGELTVERGFEQAAVAAGDCLHLDGTYPHRLSNHGDVTCRVIWVTLGPAGARP